MQNPCGETRGKVLVLCRNLYANHDLSLIYDAHYLLQGLVTDPLLISVFKFSVGLSSDR
jgi:hypothetical protein